MNLLISGGDGWLVTLSTTVAAADAYAFPSYVQIFPSHVRIGSSRMVWKPSLSRLVLRGKHQTMDLAWVEGNWE